MAVYQTRSGFSKGRVDMEVKIYQKLVHGTLSDFCQDDLPETFRAWNGERASTTSDSGGNSQYPV